MTLDALHARLDHVTPRGNGRSSSRCPAHIDLSPSLSISEGDKGLLLRCWAGCTVEEICGALGLTVGDLFYDALDPDPHKRHVAAQQRAHERQQQAAHVRMQGRRIDGLKAADFHIRSRVGLDISGWTDQKLHDELNVLADAYALLASEECGG